MAGKVIQSTLSLKDLFSKPLKDATKSIKVFNKNIKLIKKGEKPTKAFARDIKLMENKIKRSMENINKSIKSISINSIIKATKVINRLGLAGVGLGTAAFGTGIFESVNYEGFKVQLETATKDTEKASELMRKAIMFANSTPFETGQIIEATAKFEAMGLSSQKWLGITADMAGSTSKDVLQAVEAIIDAVSSGEFERLKEFGLSKKTLQAADVGGQAFTSQGGVKNQIALTELLIKTMEKKYKGGAKALSKTTKGLWSTVTGLFKNSMAKVVGITDDGTVRIGSLFDKIKKAIEKVANQFLIWQQDGTIDKISLKFDSFLKTVSDSLAPIKNMIKDVKEQFELWGQDGTIDEMKGQIKKFFDSILQSVPKVVKFISGIIPFLIKIAPILIGISIAMSILKGTYTILTAAQALLNVVMMANPFGLLVLAIFAAIGAIIAIIVYWDKLKVIFKNGVNFIYNIGLVIQNFIAGVVNVITTLINLAIKAINLIPGIKIPEIPKIEYESFVKFEKFETEKKAPSRKVSGLPGGAYGPLPANALGTNFFAGGLTRVNERGGEIIDLPIGSKIIPADKSAKLLSQNNPNTFNITINVDNANSNTIANEIANSIKLKLANI